MKKALTEAKGKFVLVPFFVGFFLVGPARSQEKWQFHSAPQEKSPGTAQVISFVGSGIPFGLMIAALSRSGDFDSLGYFLASLGTSIVGPAPGYFYGGLWGRGFSGMAARVVGVVGVLGGLAVMDDGGSSGTAICLGGACLIIGSMIYDLVNVSGAVRQRNHQRREKTVAILPTYFPRQRAVGILIQIGFD